MRRISIIAGLALAGIAATGAAANVTISNAVTQNMACSGGICAPTATNAVLNVADLEKLLESGPATVTTTGSGVQANDIVVRSALTWTIPNALTLDAYGSIAVDSTVSIVSAAGLTLATNDGGQRGLLTFEKNGHVVFSSLSSVLTINDAIYTLVGDIKTLASDIAANSSGNFALAADYDASADGTYTTSPIGTYFTGNFEGLGNAIRNLAIDDTASAYIGLFTGLGTGRISDIGVVDASVTATSTLSPIVGALVGNDDGTVSGSYSSGQINSVSGYVGGLVGQIGSAGKVDNSHTSAVVAMGANTQFCVTGYVAGLAGYNFGTITTSYATGAVSNIGTNTNPYIAGLVGVNAGDIETSFASGAIGSGFYGLCGGFVSLNYGDHEISGSIENSYATGSLTCPQGEAGGFTFANDGTISQSYSTGKAEASESAGFTVLEARRGLMRKDYWDTTSSGTDVGVYYGQSTGLKGMTTQRLQSRLPPGFSPNIWAENPKINGGLPYLIANPPLK